MELRVSIEDCYFRRLRDDDGDEDRRGRQNGRWWMMVNGADRVSLVVFL